MTRSPTPPRKRQQCLPRPGHPPARPARSTRPKSRTLEIKVAVDLDCTLHKVVMATGTTIGWCLWLLR